MMDKQTFAGIVLAGGRSVRMGMSKAELLLGKKTFLEWQLKKLEKLGISEIVVSGASCLRTSCDTRIVSDIYPERGPLGGIHACLSEIKSSCALIIPVDVPLIPEHTLSSLLDAHRKNKPDVTVLTIDGVIQPLIAIYCVRLALDIEPLIREKGRSVWALLDRCRVETVAYSGSRCLVQNCNTPEEYNALLAFYENRQG